MTPERILLVRIDRIGDMLTSTPVFTALRRTYPQARIDLVASSLNIDAVRRNPDLNETFLFPLKRFWMWPLLWARLRARRYDWAVDLNPSYSRSSGFLVWFCGARETFSFEKVKGNGFYENRSPQRPEEHMIDRQLNLSRALGALKTSPQMTFVVSEQARERAQQIYGKRSRPLRVGIFIGNAKKVHSRWPAGKFAELTEKLMRDQNLEIFILAGPTDRPLLAAFHSLGSDRCRIEQEGTLEDSGALLETCDLLITSSSGPMHLAAALGVPTLSILADHTYACWRPLGEIHHAVHCSGEDVRNIGVEDVLKESQKILEDRTAHAPLSYC